MLRKPQERSNRQSMSLPQNARVSPRTFEKRAIRQSRRSPSRRRSAAKWARKPRMVLRNSGRRRTRTRTEWKNLSLRRNNNSLIILFENSGALERRYFFAGSELLLGTTGSF